MTIDDIFKQLGALEAELTKYDHSIHGLGTALQKRQHLEQQQLAERHRAEQQAEENHVRKLFARKRELLSAVERISDGEDPLVAVLATKGTTDLN